jgi:glycosyltransferase involved in cell wall biosynthesis
LHGGYYESLVRQIAALDLNNNVYFTGWTADVPEILSLSHFTTLPSENEALGIVLMEGMAAGTPIVARVGEGGAELIEEYGAGFFYDPEQGIDSVAEKMVVHYRNAAQRESLSARCRSIAQDQFSLMHFGQTLTSVYRSVIETKERA